MPQQNAPKASKEELNALKAVYNAYLSEQHSELFKTVQKFKDSYLDNRELVLCCAAAEIYPVQPCGIY